MYQVIFIYLEIHEFTWNIIISLIFTIYKRHFNMKKINKNYVLFKNTINIYDWIY